MHQSIQGNIVDVLHKEIYSGVVHIANGKIESIENLGEPNDALPFICPGFIDSHIHIESSMLVPSRFAEMAVVHGTVATISDPHEIANVCGLEGVRYMIEDGKTVPLKFHFGAPSCVPATIFETAGSSLDADAVDTLLQNDDIFYLSEMMNFPGVLYRDEMVMAKIASAKKYDKPVDGHAPGLMGQDAIDYINAGISTDHECVTEAEALHKLQHGMKVLIREGSAAKNFEALSPLIPEHYNNLMFCSDDKHPDSLLLGHINVLCKRAVAKGFNIFNVLKMACINPVQHYKMKVGLLQSGDDADFIILQDLLEFEVLATYINGVQVSDKKTVLFTPQKAETINVFHAGPRQVADFAVKQKNDAPLTMIQALDGQLITNKIDIQPTIDGEFIIADPEKDYIKLVVVNRYADAPVAVHFLHNTGLKQGALASTVAHDSHNIVAMGVDDVSICKAVNVLVECKGGIAAVCIDDVRVLPLPVAGLMSTERGTEVAAAYTLLDKFVKERLGSSLSSPFMTLSFMALPVIPHIKLTDKGLFDVDAFSFME